ncbi:unnamed protein product [Symbiodinium sp. KB8]|nr:unnamed protein product [Symbiodinium sp. KB8]
MRASKFAASPLAFEDDPEAEAARLEKLREDDPIAWQDAINTSRALVDAVKESDIDDLRRVVANAEEGEFIQAFILQAFVMALKSSLLEITQQMVDWGVPLHSPQLSQALHLVCELVNRENFSNSWRIVKALTDGNTEGGLDINAPRQSDGWTPLCIASADACLPMAFKLLELKADPNVITRANETPLALAKRSRDDDSDEQKEARGIISNMLRSYGGQDTCKDALRMLRKTSQPAVSKESQALKEEVVTARGLLSGLSESIRPSCFVDLFPLGITRTFVINRIHWPRMT